MARVIEFYHPKDIKMGSCLRRGPARLIEFPLNNSQQFIMIGALRTKEQSVSQESKKQNDGLSSDVSYFQRHFDEYIELHAEMRVGEQYHSAIKIFDDEKLKLKDQWRELEIGISYFSSKNSIDLYIKYDRNSKTEKEDFDNLLKNLISAVEAKLKSA